MLSEQVIMALLKPSDARTSADIEQIATYCRLFSVFNEIPEHTYNSFCRIIEIEEFEPNAVIYKEGDIGSDWYIIIDGRVKVESKESSTSPTGGTLKIGDSFGRNALQQDVIRSETITCLTHVYVFRVGRRAYQEMLQATSSGLDGEGQSFASDFLSHLQETPGTHISTSILRVVFQTNSIITRQGVEPNGIYYIIHGTAAVVRQIEFPDSAKPVSRLIEIDELQPGAIFGIRSLCLNTVENVSVIAKCELVTFFLPRSDFYRKVEVHKQRDSLPPDYPSDDSIRALFKKQMEWERYKKKVVREVLREKKAKQGIAFRETKKGKIKSYFHPTPISHSKPT